MSSVQDDARRAMDRMQESSIGGATINIEWARPQESRPNPSRRPSLGNGVSRDAKCERVDSHQLQLIRRLLAEQLDATPATGATAPAAAAAAAGGPGASTSDAGRFCDVVDLATAAAHSVLAAYQTPEGSRSHGPYPHYQQRRHTHGYDERERERGRHFVSSNEGTGRERSWSRSRSRSRGRADRRGSRSDSRGRDRDRFGRRGESPLHRPRSRSRSRSRSHSRSWRRSPESGSGGDREREARHGDERSATGDEDSDGDGRRAPPAASTGAGGGPPQQEEKTVQNPFDATGPAGPTQQKRPLGWPLLPRSGVGGKTAAAAPRLAETVAAAALVMDQKGVKTEK